MQYPPYLFFNFLTGVRKYDVVGFLIWRFPSNQPKPFTKALLENTNSVQMHTRTGVSHSLFGTSIWNELLARLIGLYRIQTRRVDDDRGTSRA